ncbi:hypothetical protein H6801_01835 [Candidatus Nomurabacteria bacterium]|nr:hypothetical protein [Candidatus Nomurabacteria bacterium]
MDENNGVFASGQGYPADQTASFAQQQYQQQVPMASAQDAYTPQGYIAPEQTQSFATNAASTQSPSSNYNPGVRQDFQASNSMDAPWPTPQYAQPTQAPVAQSSLASFDAFAQQDTQKVPISTDVYSILAEPFADIGQAPVSTNKRPLIIVIVVFSVIISISIMTYVGYSAGYNKGAKTTKAVSKNTSDTNLQNITPEADSENDSSEEGATLDLTLKKSVYKDESLAGVVGEQIINTDGFIIMVTSVEGNFDDPDFVSTKNKLVKVNLLIGNIDENRSKSIEQNNFQLTNESGTPVGRINEDIDIDGGVKSAIPLSPGASAKLSVLYEVPKNQQKLFLLRSQEYLLAGKIVTVKVSVDISDSDNSSTLQSDEIQLMNNGSMVL